MIFTLWQIYLFITIVVDQLIFVKYPRSGAPLKYIKNN